MTPVVEVVHQYRALSLSERTRDLQRRIGPVVLDPDVMQWRALLITALREAKLWPGEV